MHASFQLFILITPLPSQASTCQALCPTSQSVPWWTRRGWVWPMPWSSLAVLTTSRAQGQETPHPNAHCSQGTEQSCSPWAALRSQADPRGSGQGWFQIPISIHCPPQSSAAGAEGPSPWGTLGEHFPPSEGKYGRSLNLARYLQILSRMMTMNIYYSPDYVLHPPHFCKLQIP